MLRYLLLTLAVGCGTSVDDKDSSTGIGLDSECPAINSRFDSCLAAKLFSSEVAEGPNGEKVPVSKSPSYKAWFFRDAPEAFKTEWKSGGVGGEVYGYIHLIGDFTPKNMVALLENGSRFSQIKRQDGTSVFKDSFSAKIDWSRVPDNSDGIVSKPGELHPIVLGLPVADKLSVDLRMYMQIYQDGENIRGYFYNKESVKAPLVGVIADPYGLQFKMEFFPWKGGILAYTSAVVTLKKFEDKFNPAGVGDLAKSLFHWYVSELTNNAGRIKGLSIPAMTDQSAFDPNLPQSRFIRN